MADTVTSAVTPTDTSAVTIGVTGSVGRGPSTRRASGTLRVTLTELRLLLREPGVLVGLVAFPAVTVLVLAGVFGSMPDPEFGGVRPSEHYVVGYVGVVLASLGLVALPVHVASRRELGVIRRYRAAGVGAGALLTSHAAVGVVLATASALVVLALGTAVYGLPAPEQPLAVVGWAVAGLGCFVTLGIALGTLMPSSRAASGIGNLVFVPMFLLGGGGPPREVMTGPMRALSDVLPLTHVIGGLRMSWLGATDDPRALWWTVLVTAVAAALALRTARRRPT
jgi:ABC-2 type transport system permease protein